MNPNILAVVIQQGGQIFSELLRNKSFKKVDTESSLDKFIQESDARFAQYITPSEPSQEASINIQVNSAPAQKAQEPKQKNPIATGCIPCAMGHFGTCSGLLNESVRFVNDEGLSSPEVIDRVNMCMDELNAMERIDMRPEKIEPLKGWEKDLANKVLIESRKVRHTLEGMKEKEDLEKAAAIIQTTRQDLGREWFQNKLNNLTPEDKAEVGRRIEEKLHETVNE